uniref:hypothetical protein n=1 Tax=Brucella melitensis TaxID=29459 RepID=UPI001AEE38F7
VPLAKLEAVLQNVAPVKTEIFWDSKIQASLQDKSDAFQARRDGFACADIRLRELLLHVKPA